MKTNLLNALLLVMLIFPACKQDLVEPVPQNQQTNLNKTRNTDCKEYVSYYGSTPMSLGTAHTDKIIVGFEKGTSDNIKRQTLNSYKHIISIATYHQSTISDFVIVNLKQGVSCQDVQRALADLKLKPEVLYANPFLSLGSMTVSFYDEFIVTLEADIPYSSLETIAATTNTQIVQDLGLGSYVLATTRQTNGNALDMANYFNSLPEVKFGETSFFIQQSL